VCLALLGKIIFGNTKGIVERFYNGVVPKASQREIDDFISTEIADNSFFLLRLKRCAGSLLKLDPLQRKPPSFLLSGHHTNERLRARSEENSGRDNDSSYSESESE
jgi:hypothetical protein